MTRDRANSRPGCESRHRVSVVARRGDTSHALRRGRTARSLHGDTLLIAMRDPRPRGYRR